MPVRDKAATRRRIPRGRFRRKITVMSRRRVAAAVVVLLALAGCGSTGKASGEPLVPASSAAPSASASPSPSPSPSSSPSVSPAAAVLPSVAVPPVPTMAVPTAGTTEEEPAAVYYASCAEAKRAGAAPLHRGEPGYRKGLDRDGDGVACET
jgi:hypothetical protein